MDWVLLNIVEALWWADVVGKAANGLLVTGHVIVLPLSKESDQEITSESLGQNLGEEVDVADECSLQNNWDVRSVEKLDWEWLLEASLLSSRQ